mgnify:FL=1
MDWSFGLKRRLSVLETQNRKKKVSYFCCCFRTKKKITINENGEVINSPLCGSPVNEYDRNSILSDCSIRTDDSITTKLIIVTE